VVYFQFLFEQLLQRQLKQTFNNVEKEKRRRKKKNIGFDTGEDEPCKVRPLSVYRSPRWAICGRGWQSALRPWWAICERPCGASWFCLLYDNILEFLA